MHRALLPLAGRSVAAPLALLLALFVVAAVVATPRVASADVAEAHYKSGMALKAQGKLDEAIVELEAAVAARANHGMAWNSLGILYKQKKDDTKALGAFEKAAKIMPKQAPVLSNLGMTQYRLGQI